MAVQLPPNLVKSYALFNCVNLAWSMESEVWNSIPSLGFTSKNDINKHVQAWYSIPMLVLNHEFGIGSEFLR